MEIKVSEDLEDIEIIIDLRQKIILLIYSSNGDLC